MSKEMEFFIFLIEQYAKHKNSSAAEVLKIWDALHLTDSIFDMYELYHIERIENAYEDIDTLINEKTANTQIFPHQKNS